jgi:hypothetical protein
MGFIVLYLDAFLDNYSYFNHRILDEQIDLEKMLVIKRKSRKKDKENIKQLKIRTNRKNTWEKYYMKKIAKTFTS